MNYRAILAALLAGTLAGAAIAGRQASPGLVVKTTSGTYTGFVNASVPNVNQWLGIPYGLPPVGSRRFSTQLRNLFPGRGTPGSKDECLGPESCLPLTGLSP